MLKVSTVRNPHLKRKCLVFKCQGALGTKHDGNQKNNNKKLWPLGSRHKVTYGWHLNNNAVCCSRSDSGGSSFPSIAQDCSSHCLLC